MKCFQVLLTVTCLLQVILGQIYLAPDFKNTVDAPHNVSVTEGESVTFNCSPIAIPEAEIIWFLNKQPINTDNPPERFTFSNNNRSLTVRDVCRDCVDRENGTDLTVIQCFAFNDHGYAFAQGYLNVLTRTRVMIKGPRKVPDNGYSSDSQTITLSYVPPQTYQSPEAAAGEGAEIRAVRNVILGAGALGLILLIIGILVPSKSRRKKKPSDITRGKEDVRLPDLPSMYENDGYETVDLPPRTEGMSDRSLKTPYSAYERINLGYESIETLRDDMARGDSGMPHSSTFDGYHQYDYVCAPQRKVKGRVRLKGHKGQKHISPYETVQIESGKFSKSNKRKVDDKIHCFDVDGCNPYEYVGATQRIAMDRVRLVLGDTANAVAMEDVANRKQHESVPTESGKSSMLNKRSESINKLMYIDRNREDVSDDLEPAELISKELDLCLDLDKRTSNSYLDPGPEPQNEYLELFSKELILDLDERKVNSYKDPSLEERNEYLELVSKEINPCLDPDSIKENLYMDPGSEELNQYLELRV